MKKLLLVIVLSAITCSLQAATKHKPYKNPKHYIQDSAIFMYSHGIYLIYPNKTYKITSLYKSETDGYYTYQSKMRVMSKSEMQQRLWSVATTGLPVGK